MCCSCRLVCGPAISVRLTEFATHLRLRFLGLELEVCSACHVEPAPEKGLVDLIVLDGEVVVPAPVGGELRHEEVARPIRFESDLGREFERDVLMLVEVGVEYVVGEDGADLGLGEQQEGSELHADGDIRVEIVHRRREDAMARGIELGAWDLCGCFSLLRRHADLGHDGRRLNLFAELIRGRPFGLLITGRLVVVISRAAEGRCRRLSWKPLQRRDRADREGLARGRGISRAARSHQARWRPESHLAARCCRARTVRSHIGPLPARRRQRTGLQRERPLRLSNGDAARTRSSIDTGAPGRPPASTRPLIRKA